MCQSIPYTNVFSPSETCLGRILGMDWKKYPDKKIFVQDFFNGLMPLYNDICQREFDTVMSSQRFSEFTVIYDKNLGYLRGSDGKLSSFWMSYIGMVEILLNLLRASREQPLQKPLLGVLLVTILTMLITCWHMSLRCLTWRKETQKLSNI